MADTTDSNNDSNANNGAPPSALPAVAATAPGDAGNAGGERQDRPYSRPPENVNELFTAKISGLSFETTQSTLEQIFSKYGEVADVYIPKDRGTLRPRGFAFVRYREKDCLNRAIEEGNNMEIDGRNVEVAVALQGRRDGGNRDGGRRGGGYGDGYRGRGSDRGYQDRGYGGGRYGGGGGGGYGGGRDHDHGGRGRSRDRGGDRGGDRGDRTRERSR